MYLVYCIKVTPDMPYAFPKEKTYTPTLYQLHNLFMEKEAASGQL